MAFAACLPAPMARMTVAAPVTASPPAYTPFAAGQTVIAVGDDAAVLVRLKARRGMADERVRAGADGHDHRVHIQHKFAAFLDDRAAAAGGIRFAQLHLHAAHAADFAVLVAEHLQPDW